MLLQFIVGAFRWQHNRFFWLFHRITVEQQCSQHWYDFHGVYTKVNKAAILLQYLCLLYTSNWHIVVLYSGISKKKWKEMKEKEKKGKGKDLGKVGITSFKSRSFDSWQKSGGKNL